jgi:hypothetical protein
MMIWYICFILSGKRRSGYKKESVAGNHTAQTGNDFSPVSIKK